MPQGPKTVVSREQAFAVVSGERDYQDSLWNPDTTTSNGQHTVSEFVLYMEHNLQKAREVLSTMASPGAEAAGLAFVRKVTGLGISCMEQNGAPEREGFPGRPLSFC